MASPVALGRLLSRVDNSLSDPRVQRSQYERNRVAANIEHARALLLTLEKQTSTIRIQSQKQAAETDLQAKRDWIKTLNTRLREISTTSHEDDSEEDETFDDDEDDSNEEHSRHQEDILNKYAPAVQSEAGLETGGSSTPPQDPALDAIQQQIQQKVQQELRSRKQQPNLKSTDNKSAASTTAREQLFSGRPQQQSQTHNSQPDLSKTETLMSHNRTEQETLTQGLLGLARALKESSQSFGASLESEKDVLKRAEGGLDKNAQGARVVGRIKLYAFIFGLWVACFLLVFVGPKLRF
ncbi:Putative vesicle transport protein, Use1 [Septoria linicola]|uniref:Vesicle transport protein, Use1 n=1 Tax=Septoria linicola TaxID=215465 RepID=A0A9Q9AG16_9PEZI|nr:Putative vesicle transport protein, Use1 [Septoria linicola]